MPNSIRHPRTRPRKRSVNFRSLLWAVTREAAYSVISRVPPCRYNTTREDFCRLPRYRLVAHAMMHLGRRLQGEDAYP